MGMHIGMYPVMVAIGFLAYVIYFKKVTVKQEQIDRITENRLLFVTVLGFLALVASAFIMNSFFHSIEEGKIVVGGITWLGGVLGLIPAVYYLIHVFVPKKRGDAVNCFSTMMPGLVLAHGFGRLGCFFGGCCYGARTDSFLGISFPAGSSAGMTYPDYNADPSLITPEEYDEAGKLISEALYPSLPVLPTQLFEAAFAFVLFALMVVFYKKWRYINVEIYAFAYGTFRFILEFWRGDDRGATGLFFSPSQIMSVILIVFAVFLILFKKNKVFGKLYAKCVAWREEAKNAPASGKTFSMPFRTESYEEKLRSLHKLMQDGIITEAEY